MLDSVLKRVLDAEGAQRDGEVAYPLNFQILVVEERAHEKHGHHPVMFAELANALRGIGYNVSVLTSKGWALENHGVDQGFTLFKLGRLFATAHRWGCRLGRLPPRRFSRRVSAVARTITMVIAARRFGRKIGVADVVMTSADLDPFVAAIAAGRGRWLFYQFRPPGEGRPPGSRRSGGWPVHGAAPSRALSTIARCRVARHLKYQKGLIRIVVNNEPLRDRWERAAPWLNPVSVPCIACKEVRPIPGARRRLGLDPEARLALLFGSAHGGKDHEVVWKAFDGLADWKLVIAGGGAVEAYRAWRGPGTADQNMPLLFEGFASEETRGLLHAAADLVVLSFKPGMNSDSGTLVDAITWGVPIVCSGDCFAAGVVARLGLGSLFEAGDPTSLAAAVCSSPRSLSTETVGHARDEMSAQRMATLHIAALEREWSSGAGTEAQNIHG